LKPEVDEIALDQVERLKAVLIKLQKYTFETIGSGPINSSVVIPPRSKGYIVGGPNIYIPADVREAYVKCNESLEEIIQNVEATIKAIKRKEKRARKRLSENYRVSEN